LAEFKNPQQESGNERQLLLVFVLTFVVMIVFQPLYKKYFPSPAAPPSPAATPGTQSTPATNPEPPRTNSASKGALKQAQNESSLVIENDVYRITFSSRGAQVKSWVLKKYNNDNHQPLDLVNAGAAEKFGYPLSLFTYDESLRNRINSALFVPSATGSLTVPGTVAFEYSDGALSVRKTFSFDSSYLITVQTSVFLDDKTVTAFPMWPAGFGDEANPAGYASARVEYQNGSNIERIAAKKVSGGNTIRGPFSWAAVGDQYFAAVFIPEIPQNAALVTLRNGLELPKEPKNPNSQETIRVDVIGAAAATLNSPVTERIYVGPRSLDVLEGTKVHTITGAPQDLRGLVNFGFFNLIARPLFLWLKWTYKYVHNWGWAIVLQTLIISILLLPLRISSMKSALKMQKVQPQMNSIKEKYKKYSMRDPRKQDMNQEIADLMKREGVSPAGGCLPLLIQMPFLFAYYSMLNAAIELRHAHWLWIWDLSSRDPYFVLPTLMVVSMIAAQRMTPQAGMDPQQQKMMNVVMPLTMGFIFYNLASGLNLYYSLSNLVSTVQQVVMNRTKLGREMRELAAKRARKKDK
jgi:YidC/Oxa1 family membrane protein insertase